MHAESTSSQDIQLMQGTHGYQTLTTAVQHEDVTATTNWTGGWSTDHASSLANTWVKLDVRLSANDVLHMKHKMAATTYSDCRATQQAYVLAHRIRSGT